MANLSKTEKNLEKSSFYSLIKIARPIHWVKNLGIFAALIFTGSLFKIDALIVIFKAFMAFNFAASATYVFNDFSDRKRDQLHPIKKYRPLASGALSPNLAFLELVILITLSLYISFFTSHFLFILIIVYLIIQFFYSIVLKNVPVIDILIIASGFVIRVYAGAFAINAHLSVWFLLCVISVALFLASGKRRAELSVLGSQASNTRQSLGRYSPDLLNSYVTMFGNASWMSWALFTFFESPQAATPLWLFLAEVSKTATINKLMMITIPIVIFGIMRYQSLIFEGRSETPEKLLLKDPSLVISVVLWTLAVIFVMYGGVAIS